ncbi:MAG: SCO1664 family protein [Chloroflexota bacterium]|nr:MAG: SCO1664 family protein [Chloroflexota bacterium]
MTDKELTADILKILEHGQLEMEGLVSWGSNYTFLVHITHETGELDAIYKPGRGERPLWDFARGTLCLRERAAYLTSEALRWSIVPPTVLREGPHGWGSVQFFVDHDPQIHYLTIQGEYVEQSQKIALFDVIINNADRKSGHVLLGDDGRIWAIDHGVSFHNEYKLRSVIWDFAGQSIPANLKDALVAFQSWLCYGSDPILKELGQLLDKSEMGALEDRLRRLIEDDIFPHPGPGRHYPWPLV